MAADGPIAFTQLEVAGVGKDTPLLVTGVTGALGSTLVALADRLGAHVLGISRRPAEMPPALPLAARLDASDPELTAALGAAGGDGIAAAVDNVANPARLREVLPGAGDRRQDRRLRRDRNAGAAGPAGARGAALCEEHLAARGADDDPRRPPPLLGAGRRRLPAAGRVGPGAAARVDYTIFLVTRAREEAARRGARWDGTCRLGDRRCRPSAGIVLAAVFCVLGVLPLIVLTQLGIIVGLGILLDTFVVRTLVIPALFALIGDRIWWPDSPVHTETVEQQAGRARHERSTP